MRKLQSTSQPNWGSSRRRLQLSLSSPRAGSASHRHPLDLPMISTLTSWLPPAVSRGAQGSKVHRGGGVPNVTALHSGIAQHASFRCEASPCRHSQRARGDLWSPAKGTDPSVCWRATSFNVVEIASEQSSLTLGVLSSGGCGGNGSRAVLIPDSLIQSRFLCFWLCT